MQKLFQFILFVAGAWLTIAGFAKDTLWMIIVGIILMAVAGVWVIIYIRRDSDDSDSGSSGGGFSFGDLLDP